MEGNSLKKLYFAKLSKSFKIAKLDGCRFIELQARLKFELSETGAALAIENGDKGINKQENLSYKYFKHLYASINIRNTKAEICAIFLMAVKHEKPTIRITSTKAAIWPFTMANQQLSAPMAGMMKAAEK